MAKIAAPPGVWGLTPIADPDWRNRARDTGPPMPFCHEADRINRFRGLLIG